MSEARLFLTATRLSARGLRHGFSLRGGGASEGAYAGLNLGRAVGDDPETVALNCRRLEAAAGVEPVAQVSQVHGRRMVEVPARLDAAGWAELSRVEADGLYTAAPGVSVGVRTADCVPLLACGAGEGGRTAVAAIHAGWRGTLEGIAAAGALVLGPLESVEVAIGPSIRRCCYEVDEALARRFVDALGEEVVDRTRGPKPHLDLVEANLRVLAGAGVPRERVEVLNACTACDAERFFSHRRDRGLTGRHLSFIEAPV
ncbi:MAG: polyphenol oxidase family protein [Deltaproteobacteria bacterium]|nr:polyphenol oxidase family protein [Deltaproteobacteria bacterium]